MSTRLLIGVMLEWRLLGGMVPSPRLCVLENVPGLKDKDKRTKRSNYDAVKDAFASIAFAFTSQIFDATETGIPNARSRLYMAAIAGLPTEQGQEHLAERVSESMNSMLKNAKPRPLCEFLLDSYEPTDTIVDWVPDLRKPRSASTQFKKGQDLAACPHAGDEGRYRARLANNVWYNWLTPREQHVLLLHLCHHPYPGPREGVITVQCSERFCRLATGPVPCQVPNALFWLVGKDRFLTGAEAIMLQGADLGTIPDFSAGMYTSSFLQDLAGNVFCVDQFVTWLLACLPEVEQSTT